jgi:hypothetical protein
MSGNSAKERAQRIGCQGKGVKEWLARKRVLRRGCLGKGIKVWLPSKGCKDAKERVARKIAEEWVTLEKQGAKRRVARGLPAVAGL